MNPIVIGISGKPSAQKTKLVNVLAKNLNATVIGWDEFDDQTLEAVLKSLKNNQPLVHPLPFFLYPAHAYELKSTPHIIFDAPFGFLHAETGQYIDVCIHMDGLASFDDELKMRADFVVDGTFTSAKQLNEIKKYLFAISMD